MPVEPCHQWNRIIPQLERETLAIVWLCEHFHLYLYGARFDAFTDHQPLVMIFSNPVLKPSAHLERWSLRLQPYDVTIRYQPGTKVRQITYRDIRALMFHQTLDKRKWLKICQFPGRNLYA